MTAQVELTCDKCDLTEVIPIASLFSNTYYLQAIKKWRSIDELVLCKSCARAWIKAVRKAKEKPIKKSF